MNNTNTMRDPPMTAMTDLAPLMVSLRQLISEARSRALHSVDVIQVQTCWQVGLHIVEFEQGGAARAAYGKRLLPLLAEQLTTEFGKGFDASNLRRFSISRGRTLPPLQGEGWGGDGVHAACD